VPFFHLCTGDPLGYVIIHGGKYVVSKAQGEWQGVFSINTIVFFSTKHFR